MIKEQLLKIISERNLSIRKIAEKAGLSLRTVQSWIYCGIEPTLTNAEKVFKVLGYKLEILEG